MDRRQKLSSAIRFFRPQGYPAPPPKSFSLAAKLGSTLTGSYVEGDQARGAGGSLLFKADGFLENNGVPFPPTSNASVILTFFDRNTLDALPGAVVYDYSSDINLATAVPTTAPANYDTFLKPHLSGGTGAFSDNAIEGEITVGLTKQTFAEDNELWYSDAVELGVSVQVQVSTGEGIVSSNTASSWLPITCTGLDYAYQKDFGINTMFASRVVEFNSYVDEINLQGFTRISDVTLVTQGGASTGAPGAAFSIFTSDYNVDHQANNRIRVTLFSSAVSSRSQFYLTISFNVQHDATLEQFTVSYRFIFCWNDSSTIQTTASLVQAIPAYSVPNKTACSSTSNLLGDVDSAATYNSAQLLEGVTNILPGGFVINSLVGVNYSPQDANEVSFRIDATTVKLSQAVYAEANLIQIVKQL